MQKKTILPEATALRLTPITPERVRLFNALSQRGMRLQTLVAQKQVEVRWLSDLPVFDAAFTGLFTVNGRSWRVSFENAQWLGLHSFFDSPELRRLQLAALPIELLGAVAQVLFEPFCKSLGEVLGVPVAFETLVETTRETMPSQIGAMLTWKSDNVQESHCFVRLHAEAQDVRAFVPALRDRSRKGGGFLSESVRNIPFALGVVLGGCSLSVQAIKALAAGDVVVPEVWLPAAGRCLLTLSDATGVTSAGEAMIEGRNVTLNRPMDAALEIIMNRTDELQVQLSFELDRRTITVGELKNLEPGYVFRLNKTPEEIVTVYANGCAIARARLVEVGGAVGVQLTQAIEFEHGAHDEH